MKTVWIRFKDAEEYQRKEDVLNRIIYQYPGGIEVFIYLTAENEKERPVGRAISLSGAAVLLRWLGADNVKFEGFELPEPSDVYSGESLDQIAFHLMEIDMTLKDIARVMKLR